ncbi:PAS domain S-box protein [bacterium]|nr:PAS domain S-box protein [bacterium]
MLFTRQPRAHMSQQLRHTSWLGWRGNYKTWSDNSDWNHRTIYFYETGEICLTYKRDHTMARNNRIALLISMAYCGVASLWIFMTDRLLPLLATTPFKIATLATYKGLFFIAVTTLLLYFAIHYFVRRTCNRCRSVQETINDAVIIYDLERRAILDMNKKALELFGCFTGKVRSNDSCADVEAQNINLKDPLAWLQIALTGGSNSFEWETKLSYGHKIWFDVKLQNITLNGIPRMIAVACDITERKLSENAQKRRNRTLKMLLTCNEVLTRAQNEKELFENICKIIVEDGFYRFAWVGIVGYDQEKRVFPAAHAGFDLQSSSMTDICWKDNELGRGPTGTAIREGLPCLVKDVQNDIRFLPWREEARSCGYVSVLSVPLLNVTNVLGSLTVGASEADAFDEEEMALMVQLAGDIAYGIVTLKAAADRKLMEAALYQSERNLAEAQSIASLGSWEYDLETDEEYRSDEFFRILGLPPQGNGKASDSVFDFIHPEDRIHVKENITETLEQGKPYDVEYRIIRADGSERILHAQGKTLLNNAGKTTKFIGTAFDITERKKADLALLESERRFRSLVETTSDWIWEIDKDSVYVYSSPKIRELLGYEPEEIIGKTPFDLMHPQDALRLAQKFTRLKVEREPFTAVETIYIDKTGSFITIETSGVPIFDENGNFCGYRGIDRNISDRKKLEEKYLQAQKMEAIGQLAGGIAHDFNNILTAIIGFEHLLMETVESEKSRHYALQVLALADKASNLTRDLLAFSRKQTIHPKQLDVNVTIKKIGKILKRLIGEDIELHLNLHDTPLPVMAVTGHLEQVFMNLATNARDAMPDGGFLTITTGFTQIDDSYVEFNNQGEAGSYALISFSDTGIGMDESTRLRVFEPFFTTKEVGKGTGLGLSTAYGIIRQHEGFISVYSEQKEGTTFRIYLPLIESFEERDTFSKSEIAPPRGSEVVLLVEDEPEVRQVLSSLLINHGYQVIIAIDGDHALDQYLEYEDSIDLLILDVIMPKKNGKEVYDIISKTREEMKTLFISGYTADIVEQKGIPKSCHLVSKPFSPHEFLWKVRDVLDNFPYESPRIYPCNLAG